MTSARHVLRAYDRLNSLRQPGNFQLSIDVWAQDGIKKKKNYIIRIQEYLILSILVSLLNQSFL